jgi:septal ring factor EnvC (AmiA/AmiB activator)
MRPRLSLPVILIFTSLSLLAGTALANDFPAPTPKSETIESINAHYLALTAGFLKTNEMHEPARRSIRRSYSGKRVHRKLRRRLHYKTIKGKTLTKFDVPEKGSLITSIAMTGNIEKAKGHLPWPVSSGTVSMRFGLYEVLKGIDHNSIGITIETSPGMPVNASFGGVVHSIFNIDNKPVIMIRHGKYFTTYSNLAFVSVCKDEQISTGQILGQVAENGQLDFIISDKSDNYYDPEKWLKK